MIIDYSYTKDFEDVFTELKGDPKYAQLADMDGIGKQCDIAAFSKRFFGNKVTADSSVDANANVEDNSIIAYEAEASKPVSRLNAYFLLYKYGSKLFGKATAKAMVKAQFYKDFYINDFHKFHGPSYCFNFSCMDVVVQGLPFVKKIKSEPPQHLSSYMGQMIQFVTYASNSIAGAVGLADFLVCASWFVDKLYDNTEVPKSYLRKQVKQELQSFIYSVNQPFRGGNQSAFTNVSLFDDVFLDKICEEYVFPDGNHPNKETVKELQCMYINLYNETLRKTAFTFPVTTACFAIDDDKNIIDNDFLQLVAEKNKEFGFMNIYAGKTSTLSSCCRLRSDQSNEYFNSFGSGGTKIGSASVVTLNLPRVAYMSKGDTKKFIELVEKYAHLAAKVNHVKRHIIKKRIENGNLPLYTLGFMDLSRQYSTCGINGVNEALETLGYDVLTEKGQELVKTTLTTINKVNAQMAKDFKSPHNMEQTPSENSSIKLAQVDKLLGFNDKYGLYSNQFIPLITNADLLDRMKLQGMFDADMTGGAICHLNIDTRIEDTQQIIDLIRHAVKMGVIYHAINYNVQECEHGHITVGKGERCSQCNAPITANYTRVVGFLTNTKNWHKIRREYDYPNRQFYGEV